MAIDGLIIVENTGRPIVQSGFRSTSPSYPLLHIDALNNALAKSPHSVDPVLYVTPHNTSSATACCHVQCGDIRILCPVSGDVDPLFAFAFIHTFIDILNEYFGNVSATTLKENFDVVYQLLEETLDSGGHPLTTSSNALRDIVLPPSLLNKLLSVAGANITSTINSGSGLGSGPFSSPIPWRKAGIRYASNEIYFDMVEELRAVVNRHGTPLSSHVQGKIETNCKLSGTPDCQLSFANPQILTDCAFHPCVRLKRWKESKVLSFVPPDGRFVLAEYRYAPGSTAAAARFVNTPAPTAPPLNLTRDNVPVPFTIKSAVDLEDNGGSFDITLTSRLTTRDIEHLIAEMHLGEGAGGIKCVTARGGAADRYGRGVEGVGAAWSFDSDKKILRWEIPVVSPSSSWSLRGSFTTSVQTPRPSHALQIRFEIQSHTFSALKIDQLKVTGEGYKPYKGVRGRSVGNVEWRW
ncbi:putative adaptor complexes medium subunit family protein [Lyophyllum shimeji]|uniref:Adaptor complexes medium subunit family protein n=1 Tax=Lyophyllum shimeji TaxID=47721 RepID=A0A9P3UJK6_LYOSH|nr:putative adaptor complexes medium subunit family protein [Lyophyllum shimeji]